MKHSIFIKTKSCSCAMLASVLCTGCVKDGVVEPEERIVTVLTAADPQPRGAYGDDYVYANVFMWDQNWENPVFISDSGSVSEMTLVTESGFMFYIAQKEIFDFYKDNSTTLSGDDGYSWNPNKAKRLFRVYSEKKTDSGRIEVTDRFGIVYSDRVSW